MAPDRRFVVRASRELKVQVERLVRSQRVLSMHHTGCGNVQRHGYHTPRYFLKVPLGRRAEAPIFLQASSTQEGARDKVHKNVNLVKVSSVRRL